MNSVARRIAGSELMIWLLWCGIGLYMLYQLRKSLKFGIDLVGGTYLTLEVKTNKAVEAELISKMQAMETKLKGNRSLVVLSKKIVDNALVFTFENPQQAQDAARILKADERELKQTIERNTITFSFSSA